MDFFDFYEKQMEDIPPRSPQLAAEIAIAGVNAITGRAVELCGSIGALLEKLERELLHPPFD